MSQYAWTITKDHIADPEYTPPSNLNAVGVVGPSDTNMDHEQIVNHPDSQYFKMYDDDDELYYEGYYIGDDGTEPLDDFGTPNAGAVGIKYRNKDGKMEYIN